MVRRRGRDDRGRRNLNRPDIHVAALAERLGIDSTYLSRILNGHVQQPSLELCLKLAPELGVRIEQLPALLKKYRRQREERETVEVG